MLFCLFQSFIHKKLFFLSVFFITGREKDGCSKFYLSDYYFPSRFITLETVPTNKKEGCLRDAYMSIFPPMFICRYIEPEDQNENVAHLFKENE
jgi:hypothetical protein